MAPMTEKEVFQELLGTEDPVLYAVIMENVEPADSEQERILKKLRSIFQINQY